MSTPAPAVVVEGLHKSFSRPAESMHTFKERALHPFRRTDIRTLDALRDISFDVAQGEFFGIVGRNGSGKSTLLKCMAGIYRVDRGDVLIGGRMSTFIELGVGFNPDLAARDNVILNAVMLGLRKREALERYERIIAFAELEDFQDLKIKNYSSGMLVRLAFSVMIQVDADILLIDEVLAVGDAAFQQKCHDEFNRLRDEGRTILFVTHDMAAVVRFCDRAMLLDHGNMTCIDSAERIASEYFAINFGHGGKPAEGVAAAQHGDGAVEIADAWFEDASGNRVEAVPQGERCSFVAVARFAQDVEDPEFSVLIENGEHHPAFATTSAWEEERSGRFRTGETVHFRVNFENLLAPGRYFATPTVARRGTGNDTLARVKRMASMVVTGARSGGGIVDLPHVFSIERSEVPAA